MKHFPGLTVVGCLGSFVAFGASAAGGSPVLHEVPIDCGVTSSNDGCEKSIGCPPGMKIWGARAACNLEHGAVTEDQLEGVEQGYLVVVRLSDHVEEGRCWLGDSSVASGRAATRDVVGQTRISIGCQEHDENGGDCQIRGSLYCR